MSHGCRKRAVSLYVCPEQVVHVGFIVNVNGGHSNGWKTAKLQVVRHEAAVDGHTLGEKGSSEQILKWHIFGFKEEGKSISSATPCLICCWIRFDIFYSQSEEEKWNLYATVFLPALSSGSVRLVPMIHFYWLMFRSRLLTDSPQIWFYIPASPSAGSAFHCIFLHLLVNQIRSSLGNGERKKGKSFVICESWDTCWQSTDPR